jgi:prepilin-type N-terminal cleavage/methylation domain-containing protein
VNSKGFSLVEIIVVVAILGVALTLMGMSINTIFALDVKQCAKDLAGALAKEKIEAMSKEGEVYLRLYKETGHADPKENGIFVDFCQEVFDEGVWTTTANNEKIGNTKVRITLTTKSGGTINIDDQDIIIAFNKSDGSLKMISSSWALAGLTYPTDNDYYASIKIYNSDQNSRTIEFSPVTGKFVLAA